MSFSEGASPRWRLGGPLLTNRNFTLLWTADVVSALGSQTTVVAMPLLVLALTGSPAKAGIVGVTRSLAYPLTPLPAGVLIDRWDRRRVMIGCAAGRAVAMGSLAVMLAIDQPPFWQLLVVAFLNSMLWSVSTIAERGLLPAVVAPAALPDAVVLNEARESVAVIAGPAVGGALFTVAQGLPFLADTLSFLAAGLAVGRVKLPTAVSARAAPRQSFRDAMGEGVSWLWSRPFLRAGSILYAAANVTLASVELLAILIARHHGASSAAIGVAFAVIGAGGVAGALLAGPLRRRLSTRSAVLFEPWFAVVFVPVLLLPRSALLVGVTVTVMFLPMALSSSIIVSQRLALTPDHLRGRVQASASFIAGSIGWLGPLMVGVLFQAAGETATVLSLSGWTLAVALVATCSRGLRQPPATQTTSTSGLS